MKRSLVILLFGTLALAACDEDGNGGGPGSPASGIATLGADFVSVFQQDRNDEPLLVDDMTLVPMRNKEPFTL